MDPSSIEEFGPLPALTYCQLWAAPRMTATCWMQDNMGKKLNGTKKTFYIYIYMHEIEQAITIAVNEVETHTEQVN